MKRTPIINTNLCEGPPVNNDHLSTTTGLNTALMTLLLVILTLITTVFLCPKGGRCTVLVKMISASQTGDQRPRSDCERVPGVLPQTKARNFAERQQVQRNKRGHQVRNIFRILLTIKIKFALIPMLFVMISRIYRIQ